MEIPINHILKKIDEEVKQALHKNDENEIREHFLKISTLCDVVLESGLKPKASKELPVQIEAKKSGIPDNEEDGNGESLFDF